MGDRRNTGTSSLSVGSSQSFSSSPTPSGGSPKFGTFFLGRYRVVDEIGVGGMASVHLARADGPGGFQKWVAIKRIHPHLIEDDQFIHMFLDEARIAARISHANVAQVFDLGEGDGTYWIAMEYLHGEPLREVMRCVEEGQPRMSTDVASKVIADAAEGLHAAHDLRGRNGELLGLVHRDVTPHNLFVTYDGNVKVVDFGIAKVAGRLSSTRAGTLKGKLAYMSPEQVRGAEIDRRTDIFALGVVLWELTTGHRLFRMESDLETLEKVQACIVPPPSSYVPDYPVELESIVMKALAKNPDARYQTARDFSRALQQHLLRRGVFVGPEDVGAYIRGIFGDRIRKRDAHLRWAAEVTQTINIDQFRDQAHRNDEPSLHSVSYASEVQPAAGKPPPVSQARPNVARGAPPPPQLIDDDLATVARLPNPPPANEGFAPPRPAAGAPAPRPAAGAPPQILGATAPEGYPAVARPQPQVPAPLPSFGGNAPQPAPYDDDDDEDIATVVAPARLLLPETYDRAPNAASAPSLTPTGPSAQGFPPVPGSPGMQTMQGLGPQQLPAPYGAYPARPPDPTVQITARGGGNRPTILLAVLAGAAVLTALGVVILVVLKLRSPTPTSAGPDEASGPIPTVNETASAAPPSAPQDTPQPTAQPTPTQGSSPPSISLSALPPTTATPKTTKESSPPPPTTKDTSKEKDKGSSTDDSGGPGFLTVVCNPFCDSVVAGGRSLGPSPVLRAPLPPGQHRVTLRKNGSPPKVIPVVIVSGQTSPLRVKMD